VYADCAHGGWTYFVIVCGSGFHYAVSRGSVPIKVSRGDRPSISPVRTNGESQSLRTSVYRKGALWASAGYDKGDETCMKRRIALWAILGLVVGCVWVAYAFATTPDVEVQQPIGDKAVQVIAYVTCPIVAAGPYFYWVPFVNAASYALLGFVWESMRKNSN
jgi:hypothetical protein